jgi:2-polyprenyl-3-methyl-5-hydroxy-6-metoxy-1,4-benzoquinol methylase
MRAQTYGDSYLANYGFESVLVRVRQNSVLEQLGLSADSAIVEVGCGADLLVERLPTTQPFRRWVIVEPNAAFAAAARDHASHDTRVHVIEQFFEEATREARDACNGLADVVLFSSVLHEVADPRNLLVAAHDVLSSTGRVLVNVPNSQSLHRRLAVAMGLIDVPSELSARNTDLGQQRVLDARSLTDLLTSAGFHTIESGGYFLKPFTHSQMTELPFLDQQMIAGLDQLGRDLPDLASEIYAIAVPVGRDHVD